MSPRAKRLVLAAFLCALAIIALIAIVQAILDEVGEAALGEAGALTEKTVSRPEAVPLPVFTEVSGEWGLGGWEMQGDTNMRGGVAVGDMNADGRADLAVAGGQLAVWLNTGSGFEPMELPALTDGDATSVTFGDVDADGMTDLLIGYLDGPVVVMPAVGSPWSFGQDHFTTGLVVADVTGDGEVEIIQTVYDSSDIVWRDLDGSEQDQYVLPGSGGLSMVASVFDADGDARPEIWVTRDVGWAEGPDSVYSFDAAAGAFVDIGDGLGGAQAVDGMGITAADLNGDRVLDIYVSDIGDNELLLGSPRGTGYGPSTGGASAKVGLARIRPPGSADDVVSSSWSSGATDINHDGVLDLIVVNGGFTHGEVANKIEGTEIAMVDPPAIFLGVGDGTYTDVWAQVWEASGEEPPFVVGSRGMSVVDLDGDRDADIVISNFAGGLTVLRNDTPGSISRIDARGCVGAIVEISGQGSNSNSGLSVMTVIGAQSFLGNHGAEVSVGVNELAAVTVNGQAGMWLAPNDTLDVGPICRGETP